MSPKARFVLILAVVFLADRFSKWNILDHYKEGQGFALIRGILHVTRVNNAGAAFGIFQGAGFWLIAVSMIFIVVFGIYFLKNTASFKPAVFYAAPLIVAGALGNLFDRVRYGYVVDFIDLRVWPVFNIADASICVGMGLIMLSLLKRRFAENT